MGLNESNMKSLDGQGRQRGATGAIPPELAHEMARWKVEQAAAEGTPFVEAREMYKVLGDAPPYDDTGRGSEWAAWRRIGCPLPSRGEYQGRDRQGRDVFGPVRWKRSDVRAWLQTMDVVGPHARILPPEKRDVSLR